MRVIPDVPDTIVATVNEMRAKFDYVFTTGGIGPTHDDITSENVARAFGVKWVLDPEARRRLAAGYQNESDLNEARLRMAHIPEGAVLVDNPVSRAPGFQIGNVFVLAGVPRIMQAMFDGIKHRLKGGAPVRSRSVVCNLPEGHPRRRPRQAAAALRGSRYRVLSLLPPRRAWRRPGAARHRRGTSRRRGRGAHAHDPRPRR